jgi:FkbM family methyltransferase
MLHNFTAKRQLARLVEQGLAPLVVFDVGASNGEWTREILPVLPGVRFVLFEPLANDVRYSDELLSLARSFHDVEVHAIAIGATVESVEITVFENITGSTSLATHHDLFGVTRLARPQTTIDSLVFEQGFPSPQLLKADIQGGELDLIQGALRTLPLVTVLHLEVWITREYGPSTPLLHEVMQALEPLGFRLTDIGDCFYNDDGRLIALDCLFVNRRSELAKRLGMDPWDSANQTAT